ncbi:MAG TPA: phosphatidate cytidylyltransferase, partial [Chthoniobacteraceae bacterium]|nr:phosphatidate cytidylyltransferase [Chthoniobacteraceae bacterium]
FRRLLSTIILWGIALWIIFAGFEVGFFFLIGTIGILGLWEFYRMLDQKQLPNFKVLALICGVVFFSGSFLYYSKIGLARSYDFEVAVILAFLLIVFARQMFEATRDVRPLETMSYTIFGFLYVVWLFNFVTKLVYLFPHHGDKFTGQYYVLYCIVVTKFSDMGAYLVGSLCGKHLLIPHISPKKTWEGFFGAIAFSVIGSYGTLWLAGPRLHYIDAVQAGILGVLLGFAAIIGDLAESIIKRSTNTKDSGHMLPGIGGVLDLIDSLLFTAPLLFFYSRLVLGVG